MKIYFTKPSLQSGICLTSLGPLGWHIKFINIGRKNTILKTLPKEKYPQFILYRTVVRTPIDRNT